MSSNLSKLSGGSLLVSGTAIGAGMLALPFSTGPSGLVLSIVLFFACFLFMLLTLFIFFEATMYSKRLEANIISLAGDKLGTVAQIIAWIVFLLLLYFVEAAYLSAGGGLIDNLINIVFKVKESQAVGMSLFLFVFGLIVFLGTRVVDYSNRFFMILLIISYLLIIMLITPHAHFPKLEISKPGYMLVALPIVVAAFTSHMIIPSLRTYFKNDVSQLKKVLLIGSSLPLIFYLVWQFTILGVVPATGPHGLEAMAQADSPMASLTNELHHFYGLTDFSTLIALFSCFALITSFFGVSVSLFDFLADGLKIKQTWNGRTILAVLSFVPPLLIAAFLSNVFLHALRYAGICVIILYCIYPVLMVWKSRYSLKETGLYRVFGGKFMLLVALISSIFILALQVAAELNLLPKLA